MNLVASEVRMTHGQIHFKFGAFTENHLVWWTHSQGQDVTIGECPDQPIIDTFHHCHTLWETPKLGWFQYICMLWIRVTQTFSSTI